MKYIHPSPETSIETARRTVELLKNYDGLYNMESFNPMVITYLRKNHPQIIRGQLAYDSLKDPQNKENFFIKFITTYLMMNFLSNELSGLYTAIALIRLVCLFLTVTPLLVTSAGRRLCAEAIRFCTLTIAMSPSVPWRK